MTHDIKADKHFKNVTTTERTCLRFEHFRSMSCLLSFSSLSSLSWHLKSKQMQVCNVGRQPQSVISKTQRVPIAKKTYSKKKIRVLSNYVLQVGHRGVKKQLWSYLVLECLIQRTEKCCIITLKVSPWISGCRPCHHDKTRSPKQNYVGPH